MIGRPLTLFIVALVAACTAPPDATISPEASPQVSASTAGPDSLMVVMAGDWLLDDARVDGARVQLNSDFPITLLVDGSRATGTSACNRYGADIAVVNGRIKFGPFTSTAMACQPDVNGLERMYGQALSLVDSAHLDGAALVLIGPGVELHFQALEPLAIGTFVDREWVLQRLLVDGVEVALAGDPANLVIGSDGTLRGGTGCRTFTGTYIVEGGQLIATTLSAGDSSRCIGPILQQDGTILTVFDGFGARVDGPLLELTSKGITSRYGGR